MKTHLSYFVSFLAISCFQIGFFLSDDLSGMLLCHRPLRAAMIHHFYRTYILWNLRFILVSFRYSCLCSRLCWDLA
ncbi:hypothetical protein BD769DRAFT_888877 [Suillus cothurnatus]|nr:hypothetical protein BD769DRAFT_888877 [Suillus cothurnatus]